MNEHPRKAWVLEQIILANWENFLHLQDCRSAALSPHRDILALACSNGLTLLDLKGRISSDIKAEGSVFAWVSISDGCEDGGLCPAFSQILVTAGNNVSGLRLIGFGPHVNCLSSSDNFFSYNHEEVELDGNTLLRPTLGVPSVLEQSTDGKPLIITLSDESSGWQRILKFAFGSEGEEDSTRNGLVVGVFGSPSHDAVAVVVSASHDHTGSCTPDKIHAESGVAILHAFPGGLQAVAGIPLAPWGRQSSSRDDSQESSWWSSFSLAGGRLHALLSGGWVHVWDAATGQHQACLDLRLPTASGCAVFSSLAVSVDAKIVAAGSQRGCVSILCPHFSSSHKQQPAAGISAQVQARQGLSRQVLLPPPGCGPVLLMAIARGAGSCGPSLLALHEAPRNCPLVVAHHALALGGPQAHTPLERGRVLALGAHGRIYVVHPHHLAVMVDAPARRRDPSLTAQCLAVDLFPQSSPRTLGHQEELAPWQRDILERAHLSHGPQQAMRLCQLNGWSQAGLLLRRLHLALKGSHRASEMQQVVEGLRLLDPAAGRQALAELLFAALPHVLRRKGVSAELVLAGKLLGLAAQTATDVLRQHVLAPPNSLSGPLRAQLADIAHYLETVRQLQAKMANSTITKSQEVQGGQWASKHPGDCSHEPKALCLVGAGPHIESSADMVARWQRRPYEPEFIVRDALRQGRLPLAVAHLQKMHENTSGNASREVGAVGRSIACSLLAKGRAGAAVEVLRRLGEDVHAMLRQLALGSLQRQLRASAAYQLLLLGRLSAAEALLLRYVANLERLYPSSSFWSTYRDTQPGRVGSWHSREHLCLGDSGPACRELKGVLGTVEAAAFALPEDSPSEVHSGAYLCVAPAWMARWDHNTLQRVHMEQSYLRESAGLSAELEFSVAHHDLAVMDRLLDRFAASAGLHAEVLLEIPEFEEAAKEAVAVANAPWLAVCSPLQLRRVGRVLAHRLVFLQHCLSRPLALLALLAQAGMIFATQKLHGLMLAMCTHHNLPHSLHCYLEEQHFARHPQEAAMMQAVAGACHWAVWLLLARVAGAQRPTALANLESTQGLHAASRSKATELALLLAWPQCGQPCNPAVFIWQPKFHAAMWRAASLIAPGGGAAAFGLQQWERVLFSSAAGDFSLMSCLGHGLPISFDILLQPKGIQWRNPSAYAVRPGWSPAAFLVAPEHLMQLASPLAALNIIMMQRCDQNVPPCLPLTASEQESLRSEVTALALLHFGAERVVAACVCALELCGVPSGMLRTDVAALRRVAAGNAALAESLACKLANDYVQVGTDQGSSSSAVLVLQELETSGLQSVRPGLGAWLAGAGGAGAQLRLSQQDCSTQWALVSAFCRAHQLPVSDAYLKALAQDDDWLGFLSEAQVQAFPLKRVQEVTRSSFKGSSLQAHIQNVLQSLDTRGSTPRKQGCTLFEILAWCQSTGSPGQELLRKARQHRWPLLALLATCWPDALPLSCLAAWLNITSEQVTQPATDQAAGEGMASGVAAAVAACNGRGGQADSMLVEQGEPPKKRLCRSWGFAQSSAKAAVQGSDEGVSRATPAAEAEVVALVRSLCEQQCLPALQRAFELFLPQSPLLHLVRFLQAFSAMRLREAEQQLAMCCARLQEEGGPPWVQAAIHGGLEAQLQKCRTLYEKRSLLRLLAAADFGEDGGVTVHYKRRCLSAELAMKVGSEPPEEQLLEMLLAAQKWQEARCWAAQVDSQHNATTALVTLHQARAMVAKWQRLLGAEAHERLALWEHCQALFQRHQMPALMATGFFLEHANEAGKVALAEEHRLCLLALQWMRGAFGPVSRDFLLQNAPSDESLEARVWLLAAQVDSRHNHGGAGALEETAQALAHAMPPGKQQAMYCLPRIPKSSRLQFSDVISEEEKAVLLLLEVGQVSAARQMAQGLKEMPKELFLVEAYQALALGESLPTQVTSRMNELGHFPTDIEEGASLVAALEEAANACRAGGGRGQLQGMAARMAAALALGMPYAQAAQQPPKHLLRLLALKGQDALPAAHSLLDAHFVDAPEIARSLAAAFHKGLVAAFTGGYLESAVGEEGPTPLLWRECDFSLWTALCPRQEELGHALLELLLPRGDLAPACEVELLLLVQRLYSQGGCLGGLDVLEKLSIRCAESYVRSGAVKPALRLLQALPDSRPLQFVLDRFVAAGRVAAVLDAEADTAKIPAVNLEIVQGRLLELRLAVLSALKRILPWDQAALNMVYEHFGMRHELAQAHENSASDTVHRWLDEDWFDDDEDGSSEVLLGAMNTMCRSAECWLAADCGQAAARCGAQASLLALQVRQPERRWVVLSDTGARRLMGEQSRVTEALVVARAYGLTQAADWTPMLWAQLLQPRHLALYMADFCSALPLPPPVLMELAGYYRAEVAARGEQLRHLGSAFLQILELVPDLQIRLQAATVAGDFPGVIENCLRRLDRVPTGAGPILIRKGHGGTYMPLM